MPKKYLVLLLVIAQFCVGIMVAPAAKAASYDYNGNFRADVAPYSWNRNPSAPTDLQLPNWVTSVNITSQSYWYVPEGGSMQVSSIELNGEVRSTDSQVSWQITDLPVGTISLPYVATASDGTTASGSLEITRANATEVNCPTLDPITHRVLDYKDSVPPSQAGSWIHTVNWSGCDLTGIRFEPTWFNDAHTESMPTTFESSNFQNTIFDEFTFDSGLPLFNFASNLSGASFKHAQQGLIQVQQCYSISGVDFSNSNADLLVIETPARQINMNGASGFFLFSNTDITGSTLIGANLRGMDIRNTTVDGVDLSKVNFAGSMQGYIDFQSAKGTKFVGANFKNMHINASNIGAFEGSDFSNADLSGTSINYQEFLHTDFTRANLAGSNLSNSNFGTSNFSRANLRNTVINGAKFGQSKFDFVRSGDIFGSPESLPDGFRVFKGYLAGPKADLSYVSFFGDNLSGFNLAGANLNFVDATNSTFEGANLSGATMNYSNFVDASLANADLSNSHFDYADMHRAKLVGSNMEGAFYFGTNLTDAVLSQPATIGGAFLRPQAVASVKPSLRNSNFMNSDLKNAVFDGADLSGSNFKNANLSKTSFAGVNWKNVTCVDGAVSLNHVAGSCLKPLGVSKPGRPSSLRVTQSPAAARLSFKYQSPDTAAMPDRFALQVSSRPNGNYVSTKAVCDVEAYSCDLSSLADGAKYYLRISAHNNRGWSKYSSNTVALNLLHKQATISVVRSKATAPKNASVALSYSGGSGSGQVIYSVKGNGCVIAGSSLKLSASATARSVACDVRVRKAASLNFDEAESAPVRFTFR